MKINPKQYAEAFYQAVQDKKDGEVKSAIKNFAGIIVENNDANKADEIIEQFSKLWNKEKGIVEAEVLSADELDKSVVALLKNYIIKLSGAEEAVVKQTVNKGLLGGVVIKYEDKVLDGSLRTRLEKLKEEMIK